ncbi:MAG: 5-formyltetrahydrofolate cyclo-ligase [bacterium]|nr:5-formyltetrahydrofolate cyclo-ligase [bacterium]
MSAKRDLRQRLRKILAAIPPDKIKPRSAACCKLLIGQREYRKAEIIMVFLSLPSELDTTPLVLRAWQDRKRVVAPKVSWEQKRMMPIEIRSLTDDLAETSLEIREPVAGVPIPVSMIDLVIVPGLGFDAQGNRLGRGRGFYDRFLAHPDFRAVKCAVTFEEQLCREIPSDPLDVRVDMVVTDTKVRRVKK